MTETETPEAQEAGEPDAEQAEVLEINPELAERIAQAVQAQVPVQAPGLPPAERQLLDMLDWVSDGADPLADNAVHWQQIKHLDDVVGLVVTEELSVTGGEAKLLVRLSGAGQFEQTRLSAKEVRLLAQAASEATDEDTADDHE